LRNKYKQSNEKTASSASSGISTAAQMGAGAKTEVPQGSMLEEVIYFKMLSAQADVRKHLSSGVLESGGAADEDDGSSAPIEMELRIGMLCNRQEGRYYPTSKAKGAIEAAQAGLDTTFDSGVSPLTFQRVSAVMSSRWKEMGLERHTSREIVYGFTMTGPGNTNKGRVVYDLDKNQIRQETKERISTVDVALPSCAYDIRLGTAREVPTDDENGSKKVEEVRNSAKTLDRREKSRTSYQGKYWRLDLTSVEVIEPNVSERIYGYEIELEMTPATTDAWLNSAMDANGFNMLVKDLAVECKGWVNLLNPSDTTLDPMDPARVLRAPTSLEERALMICDQLSRKLKGGAGGGGGGYHQQKFPGAMPVSMGKHHIQKVQTSECGYFVTEKTDGVRQLLVAVNSGEAGAGTECVLVDRKSQIKMLNGGGHMSLPHGTVLDGEVVYNLHFQRSVFMVFDILSVGRQPGPGEGDEGAVEYLTHLKFRERIKHLGKLEAEYFRPHRVGDGVRGVGMQHDRGMVPVILKKFFKRSSIDDLLTKVASSNGEHIYSADLEGQGEFHPNGIKHFTDGVIFQPDSPYVMGTDFGLLKWKWLDTVTVDMRVQMCDGYPTFFCGNGNGDEVRFTNEQLSLNRFDCKRLLRDMAENKKREGYQPDQDIAEVGFDPSAGAWYYKLMRDDKDRPNHISVVSHTLVELAENMTAAELEYRMLCDKPVNDDWDLQLSKMMGACVQHKRKIKQEQKTARAQAKKK